MFKSPICLVHKLLLAATVWSAFFGALPTLAQYRFDHWTDDNGLPNNWIKGITQTHDSEMNEGEGEMAFGSGFVPTIERWPYDDFPAPPPGCNLGE